MVFLPPLPEVGCPIFLEIRNPWGKVIERSGLIYEHFCLKIVKNCCAIFIFIFFSTFFCAAILDNFQTKMFISEITSFHYFSPRIPNL